MAEMERAEAAALLGISENADKATVNAAARKLIAKYHPDAVRNKTPQEQAQAEKMFKAVNKAKKIMLEPPKPKTEPVPQQQQYQPRSSSTPQQTRQAPRQTQQTSSRAQSSTAHQRNKYNTATTFMSNIPHVADNEESVLYGMYDAEARARYKQGSDMFRLTWSIIPSVLVLALTVFRLVTGLMSSQAIQGTSGILTFDFWPYAIMALICMVKLVVYDLILSHVISTALSRNNWMPKISLAGLELSILAGVYMFLTNPTTDVIAIALLFIGFVVLGGGYIGAMIKRRRIESAIEEQAYGGM